MSMRWSSGDDWGWEAYEDFFPWFSAGEQHGASSSSAGERWSRGKAGKCTEEGEKGKGKGKVSKDALNGTAWALAQAGIDEISGKIESPNDSSAKRRRRGGKMSDEEFGRLRGESEKAIAEGRTLFVRGLPLLWNSKQVKTFFEKQGPVQRVALVHKREGDEPDKRVAHIEFETADSCTRAVAVINRLDFTDQTGEFLLRCSIREPREKVLEEFRSVYLANLPISYSEDHIVLMMEKYGVVNDVNMLPVQTGTHCCFVTMNQSDDAATAIAAINGILIEGTLIEARFPNSVASASPSLAAPAALPVTHKPVVVPARRPREGKAITSS